MDAVVIFQLKLCLWNCLLSFLQEGGLGSLNFPLLSDLHKKISKDYGVLLEDAGVALRYSSDIVFCYLD